MKKKVKSLSLKLPPLEVVRDNNRRKLTVSIRNLESPLLYGTEMMLPILPNLGEQLILSNENRQKLAKTVLDNRDEYEDILNQDKKLKWDFDNINTELANYVWVTSKTIFHDRIYIGLTKRQYDPLWEIYDKPNG